MSTKENILSALRREHLSVAGLCQRLGVTRNAINVQLKQLSAAGLVRTVPVAHRGQLGKPALVYEAAPHSEDIASNAYQPFLSSLLRTVSGRIDGTALKDVLDETGRQMARQAGLCASLDFEDGLEAAVKVAATLGASTEIVRQHDGVMVRNYSCPIGTVVRGEPCACRVMAAFFAEATGRPVTERCRREERLICQYWIAAA